MLGIFLFIRQPDFAGIRLNITSACAVEALPNGVRDLILCLLRKHIRHSKILHKRHDLRIAITRYRVEFASFCRNSPTVVSGAKVGLYLRCP